MKFSPHQIDLTGIWLLQHKEIVTVDFQDLIEQSYLKLSTKEHRKTYAQFFTPPAIASLMAAYILDNKNCSKILDPANGLTIFGRALDEHLKLINHRLFDSQYQFVNALSYSRLHEIGKHQSLQCSHIKNKRSSLSSLFYNYEELHHALALSQLPLEVCLLSELSAPAAASDFSTDSASSAGSDSAVASARESTTLSLAECDAKSQYCPDTCAHLSWFISTPRLSCTKESHPFGSESLILNHTYNSFTLGAKLKHPEVAPKYLSTEPPLPLEQAWIEAQKQDNSLELNAKLTPYFLREYDGSLTLDEAQLLPGSGQIILTAQQEPSLPKTKVTSAFEPTPDSVNKMQHHSPAQVSESAADDTASSSLASCEDTLAVFSAVPKSSLAIAPNSLAPSAQSQEKEPYDLAARVNAIMSNGDEILCLSSDSPSCPERKVQLVAYEIDPIIAEFAALSSVQIPLRFVDVDFRLKDYLKSNFKDRYDGIICNPPYKTFKDFARKSHSITLIEERLDLKLSGRTNLYALFLLKSLYQLKPNGRCAYLIPYEFLNSSFGIKIKEHLLKQRNLAYVITFDVKGPIFDNATTTCGLFLFDNSKEQKQVEFITLHTIDELEQLTIRLCPNLIASYPETHKSFQRYVATLSSKLTKEPAKPAFSLSECLMHSMEEQKQLPPEIAKAIALAPSLVSALPEPMLNTLLHQAQHLKAAHLTQAPPVASSTATSTSGTEAKAILNGAPSLNAKSSSATSTTSNTAISEVLKSEPALRTLTLQGRTVPYSQLKAKQKWHMYYQNRGRQQQTPLLFSGSNLSAFDQFIKVKRGLATGANEFFLFNRSKVAETKIPMQYFVKVIPRANFIQKPIFTQDDFKQLEQQDAPIYLLNAPDQVEDPYLKKYLAYGEAQELHRRYLTRHRCPWYALERRQVAPILISVFNRGSMNVVRNEAQIFNLTTFHSIFVLKEEQTELIFAYLLTNLAKEIILQNRREYGGGLEKLEPLDINHAACINFNQLSQPDVAEILQLYHSYRRQLIAGHAHGELIEQISQVFQRNL